MVSPKIFVSYLLCIIAVFTSGGCSATIRGTYKLFRKKPNLNRLPLPGLVILIKRVPEPKIFSTSKFLEQVNDGRKLPFNDGRKLPSLSSNYPMLLKRSKIIKEPLENEYLHYSVLRTQSPKNLLKSFSSNKVVTDLKVVPLTPSTNTQYEKVYNKAPSLSAERDLKKLQLRIASYKDSKSLIEIDPKQPDLKLKLFNNIRDSEGDTFVIIAHSEKNGTLLKLPNGHNMGINELHSQCIKFLKKCMVLTCYGDDFNIQESISAFDALEIWEEMASQWLSHERLKIDDLVKLAKNVRKEQKTKRKIIITSSTLLVGVGVTVVIYSAEGR